MGALEQKGAVGGAGASQTFEDGLQPFYNVHEYIFSSNLNLVSEFLS